jgi:hypothetical protein
MRINDAQLHLAINEFIDREILPLSSNMAFPQQFVFGFKMGVIKRKIKDVVNGYLSKGELKMLGLVDENGYIDAETMYQAAVEQFKHIPSVELAGITFKETDLQNLYNTIQKYAGGQQ